MNQVDRVNIKVVNGPLIIGHGRCVQMLQRSFAEFGEAISTMMDHQMANDYFISK
jgi:hypothetical protein